jgi:uncharacterized Zn-finger protein
LNFCRSSCKERTISTPNLATLLPFTLKKIEEPIDLSKSLKRSRQSSIDQPIDYSMINKRMDFNLQHISHVFGNNKQEKKLKKTQDDDEDHRPLTPISSLSSSPPNISLLEKKILSNDIPPTPTMTIRSRDRYCCSYCSKTFPRSANLTRHLRTHTDKYLFQTIFHDEKLGG